MAIFPAEQGFDYSRSGCVPEREHLRLTRHPASAVLAPHNSSSSLGVAMDDFWAIFITVVVFTLLFLIIKGVERLER